MDSEFFRNGVLVPHFFGHTKFEVTNFSEFFHLKRAVDSEFFIGGSGHQLFLVMLNLRPKKYSEFFHLQSALDSEFFRGGVCSSTFFDHAKFEVKNF